LSGLLAADGPAHGLFGTWFFGNRIIPEGWNPAAPGASGAWQLSPQLEPLKDVKPWVTVVSGLRVKVPNLYAHKSMPATVLTGAQAVRAGNVQLPSIDQRIAPLIGKGTTFPTGLHVGISSTTGAGALDFNISFNGANAPNPPEYGPARLFQKLLGVSPSLARRRRVLDAVAEDARAFKPRLGKECAPAHEGADHTRAASARRRLRPRWPIPDPGPARIVTRGRRGRGSRSAGQGARACGRRATRDGR
jgi:hypothetical protein